MRYTTHSLPYSASFHDYYHEIRQWPGAILLESAHLGRYDILTAKPYDVFQCLLQDLPHCKPFEILESLVPHEDLSLDIPFQGGVIGYLAYDVGAYTQTQYIPPTLPGLDKLPCVYFGLYDWAILRDHQKKETILFAAHRDASTQSIIKDVLQQWQSQSQPEATIHSAFTPMMSTEQYQAGFSTIQTALQQGRCYQVNFTQAFQSSFSGDVFALYQTIQQHNPMPYAALLQLPEAHILCFSPERFLTIDKNQVIASPIKGTAKRVADPIIDQTIQEALQQCEKNRAENVMIVDLLRNDLSKIATVGSVQVPRLLAIESYTGLHHLVSDVHATLKNGISPAEALQHCFPGGSITGAPKLEAMRVINEVEHSARGIYCGNIFYYSAHGRLDSNIAIRTLIAQNSQLYAYAGGGIVIDSTWESEYAECFTKIHAIQSALQDFQPSY
ncbi:MAG: aminodeoxychorismate synthase component I [Legionellaceae bacterium]|nr:aminodeoxychorismate synthase component I [Legionellaceae bacterium]